MKQFEEILKKNHGGNGWAAGDSFSFADLVLFGIAESIIDQVFLSILFLSYLTFPQEWNIDSFPVLKAHHERVLAHSASLAAYVKSEKRYPARKF